MAVRKKQNQKQKPSGEGRATKPGVMIVVRLLTLVAMAISVHLAWVSVTGGTAIGCGPESGCDEVLRSRWAKWLGVPVSVGALGVYATMFGVSFCVGEGRRQETVRRAWGILIVCALLVMGAGLWFVGLQLLVMKAICPYCRGSSLGRE